MAKEKILVIEDEEDIFELVRYNLTKEGFSVIGAFSGEEGLKIAKSKSPDIILLDLMLPNIDGLDVCRNLRSQDDTSKIPIIMLTAKSDEADIVTGLELGADDYVTKPFSPRILLARIKAVLRRNKHKPVTIDADLNVHNIRIHSGRHEVLLDDKSLDLTHTEFQILHFLASRPGWVFTRYQIVNAVKGEEYFVTDRSVDVHITLLRKKLGSSGKYIETVRGVGYRFRE